MTRLKLYLIPIVLSVLFATNSYASELLDLEENDVEEFVKDKVTEWIESKLPPFIELSHSATSDGKDGYKLSYDWKESSKGATYQRGENEVATEIYDFSVFANGSHALRNADNTSNLSNAGFEFSYIHVDLGAITRVESAAYQTCFMPLDPEDDNYDQQAQACQDQHPAQLKQTQQQNQWAYGVNAIAKLEADEGYTQKQIVYGLELLGTGSPKQGSIYDQANFLDWPFKLMRKAFPIDGSYAPNLPVIRLGVQRVEVEENDARTAVLPDDDTFTRAFGELSFTTIIAKIDNKPAKLSMAYEYYEELNAEDAIKEADLDQFGFFSTSISIPTSTFLSGLTDESKIFARYTKGELPFDRKDTKAFEVGFRTNLDFKSLLPM